MRRHLLEKPGLVVAWSFGLALLGAGAANQVRAATIIVPNALATQEGNSNNAIPFNFASRYQQVFAHTEFPLAGPGLITEILFRPDATFGKAFSATIPDITISLSTTVATSDALNPLFSNNIGSNVTLVHSGPLALSSGFAGPIAGPKNFDIAINLQTPFLYDPAQGDLLLDIKNFTDNSAVPVFDAQNIVGDSISRLWNDADVNSDMAFFGNGNPDDFSNSLGLVTEFSISLIDEPGSLLILAVGLLSVFYCRYRYSPNGRQEQLWS